MCPATVIKTDDRYVLICEGARVKFRRLITLARYARTLNMQLRGNH